MENINYNEIGIIKEYKKDITIYQLKRKYSDEIDILFDGDISFEGKSNNKWLFKCKSKTNYFNLLMRLQSI